MQAPSEHTSYVSQALPHAPQFASSLSRSMQATASGVPQFVRPLEHTSVIWPFWQTWSGPHALPQPPQFAGSLAISVQPVSQPTRPSSQVGWH